MRFMMMVIAKSCASDAVIRRIEYTKTLQKAGVLRAFEGLNSPYAGARISYANAKAAVSDSDANEAITGYWILHVRSREEAIEWAKRAPMSSDEVIDVRQIHDDVQTDERCC
ncbi:MAG: YciI family protein [Thermoanaerobaculia bacterium]